PPSTGSGVPVADVHDAHALGPPGAVHVLPLPGGSGRPADRGLGCTHRAVSLVGQPGAVALAGRAAPGDAPPTAPVWGVHLAYFGLVMVGSVWVYQLPEVQAVLLSLVRDALGGSQGPLAIAGKAYASGSIPRAAVVTFLINFLLGTLVSI